MTLPATSGAGESYALGDNSQLGCAWESPFLRRMGKFNSTVPRFSASGG
ncbi:MAG: hypothetical protein F6J90_10700 [Moorea sp. SIOASIH]|nr:hypothetical protein [Moorena sp. SIOASIH]NEO36754.1 hypothetical protein [Moorena sp. SIOASIH]NEO89739.1 hypothetical protein [Moorena sp. SIO3G5]